MAFMTIAILILAFVILFAVTKDRWNWKKWIKRVLIWGIGFIVLIAGGVFVYNKYQQKPRKQSEYMGIKLTDTMEDVKFKKGKAEEDIDNDTNKQRWNYSLANYTDAEVNPTFAVYWKDNKVRIIACVAEEPRAFYCNEVNGLRIGDSTQSMIDKLGNEYEISTNKNKETRSYAFKKYNNLFILEKDKIKAVGIYNPDLGKPKLKD